MDSNEHALGLGKIIANLHGLELLLRIFLCEENGDADGDGKGLPTSMPASMKDTYITNYKSLGQLIDQYNKKLTSAELALSVDEAVVKIRDAIAHGRLMSTSESFPLTLYKFGKPVSGDVPLEAIEILTKDWLKLNCYKILQQVNNVLSCSKGRGYKSM